MIRLIVRILNAVEFSESSSMFFLRKFLEFWSDTIEKPGIKNFSNKSCAILVLSDFEVTFLEEMEDTTFSLFLYCVLFIHSLA